MQLIDSTPYAPFLRTRRKSGATIIIYMYITCFLRRYRLSNYNDDNNGFRRGPPKTRVSVYSGNFLLYIYYTHDRHKQSGKKYIHGTLYPGCSVRFWAILVHVRVAPRGQCTTGEYFTNISDLVEGRVEK